MKKFKRCMVSVVLAGGMFFGVQNIHYASQDSNVTLTRISNNKFAGNSATFWQNYVFGTTTIYNNQGNTSTTSGMIDVSNCEYKTVGIHINSISGGGTLTVKIRSFVGTDTTACNTLTVQRGTTTPFVPIQLGEYCRWINIGVSTTIGTISASIIGDFSYAK